MHKLGFVLFILAFFSACSQSAKRTSSQPDVLRKTQELFDAVAAGNKGPWNRYIAEDVMYFDEQGHNMDKKALVAGIEPLPPGIRGTIMIANSKVNIQGDTLIHAYDMNETEDFHGQELHARYHATDTWIKRNDQWQIVAGQVLRYYEDPAPGVVDRRKFPGYVGTYALGEEREIVSSKNGKLYLKRGARPPVELIPETADIFFRKGVEGRTLFHYMDGKIDSLIDRRNNEDVVWHKIK